MSIYISFYAKRNVSPPDVQSFDDHLPFDPGVHPPQVHIFDKGRSRLIVWQWDAVIDRSARVEDDGILFVQGYGDTAAEPLEARLLRAFRRSSPIEDVYGGFAALFHTDDGISGYSSLTGMDPIFIREENSFVALSNRIAVLAALGDLSVREDALISLCGRTHLQDHGTVFEGIRRVTPGGTVRVSEHGLTITGGSLSHLVDDFDLEASSNYLDTAIDGFAYTLTNRSRPLEIALSGGKDSRAILAIVDYAGQFDDHVSVLTFGHHFDPEVLAARNVLELYDHPTAMHTIETPAFAEPTSDLIGAMATTLFTWEGHMSLADRDSYVLRNDHFILGGHELGMKYWGGRLELEAHMKAPTFPVNVSGLLNDAAYKLALTRYGEVLGPFLADIPPAKFNIAEAWAFRNPNFAVHDLLRRNAAEYRFHPLLDISFIKLLLNCPVEMTRNQLLHYLIMTKARVPLHTVPFAGDRWPPDLVDSLRTLALPLDGIDTPPHEFNPDLPDARGRGLFNWRVESLRLGRRLLSNALAGRPTRFDFLDYDRVDELLTMPLERATVTDLYAGLGLLNAVILSEYGSAFLKRTNLDGLTNELASRMGDESSPRSPSAKDYEKTLQEYDRALGTLAKTNHELRYAGHKPLHHALDRFHMLTDDPVLLRVSGADLGGEMTLRGSIVTSPIEVRNAALAIIRFDGTPVELSGFVKSEDPEIGWFRYLPRSYGTEQPFKMVVPVPREVLSVEVELRRWGARASIHLADLRIFDARGTRVEIVD